MFARPYIGNMGAEGVLKFLKSHKCNRGCEHLQLPSMSRSLAVTQVCKMLTTRKRELQLHYPSQKRWSTTMPCCHCSPLLANILHTSRRQVRSACASRTCLDQRMCML